MEHLHMNNNSLSGKIPSELSKMPGLLHLLLDNNDLSGPLPPKLAETHSLKILSIEANNIDGAVPLAIWSNLTYKGNGSLVLDFQNNSLDTIPDAFEPPKAVVLLQLLAGWEITLPDVFGPYELLNFTYADEFSTVISSGLSKGALAGILVKSAYRSGDIAGILDSQMSSCPPECATRFLLLALKCCQDETDERPYMAEIVRELDGIRCV
ncbi:hypothetical protein ACQ4PT_044564 [Festuca glaucescens]